MTVVTILLLLLLSFVFVIVINAIDIIDEGIKNKSRRRNNRSQQRPVHHPTFTPPNRHSNNNNNGDDHQRQEQQQTNYEIDVMSSLMYDSSPSSLLGSSRNNNNNNGRRRQRPQSRFLQDEQQIVDDNNYNSGGSAGSDNTSSAILRRDLLKNYDKGSYPFELVWNTNIQETEKNNNDDINNTEGEQQQQQLYRKGLPIEISINFHKVFDVDVVDSVVDLIVWYRQRWYDPRLTWDPNNYDNITEIKFWIGDGTGIGGETSEIWTPDIELWNLDTSISETLVDTQATVTYDGTIFWSRPGHIRPVCKFYGLEQFPFDTLNCTMEFGSWTYSGLYLRPQKLDDGVSIGGSNTAGQKYAEFTLENVLVEEYTYPPFPYAPEEDWPVMFYHVIFTRASAPYIRGFLLLQVILTFVAFTCFWIPPHCGERMGLAITALLAAVASELVIASNIPASKEFTWFAKFSMVSLIYSSVSLFQSAIVIFFHYYQKDSLMPSWVTWIYNILFCCRRCTSDSNKKDDSNDNSNHVGGISDETEKCGDSHEKQDNNGSTNSNVKKSGNQEDHQTDEHFYDSVENETIGGSDAGRGTGDGNKNKSQQDNNNNTRGSVVRLDANDFKSKREKDNNEYWQEYAENIDIVSRYFFPLTFILALIILFQRK